MYRNELYCDVCRVAKVVAPKKAALQKSEAEYAVLMEGLAAKKAELASVVAALDALNTKLAAMQVNARPTNLDVDLFGRGWQGRREEEIFPK